jgi:undecaprenyl-diphosphatase
LQIPDENPAKTPGQNELYTPVAAAGPRRRLGFSTRRIEPVFATALLIYAVLAVLANRYAYFTWDLELARWIQSISVPGFHSLMKWVSLAGNGATPFLLVLLAGGVMLIGRLRIEAAICCVGAALGSTLDTLLKEISDRPRPPSSLVQVLGHYTNESFPSGHVFFYVEFFGFLLFLSVVYLKPGLPRAAILIVLALLIALVGVSRVYLGAHWPSDVAGAYLAGGIWLWLMIAIYRRLRT